MTRVAVAFLVGVASGLAAAYALLMALTSDFDDAWTPRLPAILDREATFWVRVNLDGLTDWDGPIT